MNPRRPVDRLLLGMFVYDFGAALIQVSEGHTGWARVWFAVAAACLALYR